MNTLEGVQIGIADRRVAAAEARGGGRRRGPE